MKVGNIFDGINEMLCQKKEKCGVEVWCDGGTG
jgi:hypothetical protein